jgi:hypothetical protein
MFGLLFSSIGAVVQSGFVIGVGILVDTFVVRHHHGARHRRFTRAVELVAGASMGAPPAGRKEND